MARHTTLAQFEFFVLLAVERLGPETYGGDIRRSIETAVERPTSLGAVYAAVSRLEEKGYLTHSLGPRSPVRGGRRRKLLRLTPKGAEELRHTERIVRKMLDRESLPDAEAPSI